MCHERRKDIHEKIYQSLLTMPLFVERFVEEHWELKGTPRKKPVVMAEQRAPSYIPPP
jgi:hypothetical protein